VADVHHVTVLHDVIFAFEAERAFGAGGGFGAGVEELVPADGFGADEVFFQIGVNGSCGFLSASIGRNLPGATFIFASGEKRNQAEQLVGCPNSAASASLISESSASTLPQMAVAAALGRAAISVSLYLLTAASSSLPNSVDSPMLST